MLTDQSSHGAESTGTWCKSVPPSESKLSDINCLSNGGKRVAISKTLIENVSVVKKAETWHSLVVHWYSFENCIECVGGRDETMVFFSKLLANVSFGKFFITKTFCRFFPPLFFIITKMLCRFFFSPLSPSSFGACHPLCWAPTGICYRWPFFIHVPGWRRSASHSTVVGKPMLAWDKEVLVHSLSRMPLKPLF